MIDEEAGHVLPDVGAAAILDLRRVGGAACFGQELAPELAGAALQSGRRGTPLGARPGGVLGGGDPRPEGIDRGTHVVEGVRLVSGCVPVARRGDSLNPSRVELLGGAEHGERGGDGLDPAASVVADQALSDERSGRRGGARCEPVGDALEGGAAVLSSHRGDHRGPEILVAEGAALRALLRADPGGLQGFVPGAEADRGGLVTGDVVLTRPGGEGLAGGAAGLGMEGAEVLDDLRLSASGRLPGRVEGGLVPGASAAQ